MATLIDNGGDSGDIVVDAMDMNVVVHDRLCQLPLLLVLERGLALLAIEFDLALDLLRGSAAGSAATSSRT